ncbi:MAG: GH3 auxin-responsive promoter family protein [Saprospiraceae bacterium]
MYETPSELQNEVSAMLMSNLFLTQYGRQFGIKRMVSVDVFRKEVPLVTYEDIFPFIDKMMQHEEDQLWPGKVQWFAKSSGTTNDKSKYIPITDHNLFENHVTASWDAISILYRNQPDARIFDGKNLIMGGSLQSQGEEIKIGDVSAILLSRMPAIGRPFYSPDFDTALLSDWEEKIQRMAEICKEDDIVMFAGVPTWTIVLFNKILEVTGKNSMEEVWPNLQTYFHGGVGFDPYRKQFQEFFPKNRLKYYEVYNASEGYFAVQDRENESGMLLLLDNAIFYEFLPLDEIDTNNPKTLLPHEVELDVDYVIIISTSSGLWRYMPGDVIKFVSKSPYRIKVSGRTKHYINIFGEELMVHNAENAIQKTCSEHHASIVDYTVGPIFMENRAKGGHEWYIEFDKQPLHLDGFAKSLDAHLRQLNSDYDAKRTKDIALQNLVVQPLPKGTFHNWLKSKGKVGGQSKIPRLCNSRQYLDILNDFILQSN